MAEQNTQLTVKERTNNLRSLLEAGKDSLKQVLPKHMTPERMVKLTLVAASRTPKLLQCSPQSILQALMDAGELGLEPNTALGHAYLVPYWNKRMNCYEAKFIAGYRGLCDLALRSSRVLAIDARAVYEKDTFKCTYGLREKLIHEPTLAGDRGDFFCAYAIARMANGHPKFVVLSRADVERIRSRSQSKDDGPWRDDYEAMAMKSAIRNLSKTLPMSHEFARALEADDALEMDIDLPAGDVIPTEPVKTSDVPTAPATKADKIADKLKDKVQDTPPAAAETAQTAATEPTPPVQASTEEPPKQPDPPKGGGKTRARRADPPAPAATMAQTSSPAEGQKTGAQLLAEGDAAYAARNGKPPGPAAAAPTHTRAPIDGPADTADPHMVANHFMSNPNLNLGVRDRLMELKRRGLQINDGAILARIVPEAHVTDNMAELDALLTVRSGKPAAQDDSDQAKIIATHMNKPGIKPEVRRRLEEINLRLLTKQDLVNLPRLVGLANSHGAYEEIDNLIASRPLINPSAADAQPQAERAADPPPVSALPPGQMNKAQLAVVTLLKDGTLPPAVREKLEEVGRRKLQEADVHFVIKGVREGTRGDFAELDSLIKHRQPVQ